MRYTKNSPCWKCSEIIKILSKIYQIDFWWFVYWWWALSQSMIVQRESEYRKIQKLWINSTKVVDTTGMQYLRPLHYNALASKHDCDRLFWDIFSTFRPLRFLLFDLARRKGTNHEIPLCLPSISIVRHLWLIVPIKLYKTCFQNGVVSRPRVGAL